MGPPDAVPLDTSPEVSGRLVAAWRAVTLAERFELIAQMYADVDTLARAGMRWLHPEFSERQVIGELARRRSCRSWPTQRSLLS